MYVDIFLNIFCDYFHFFLWVSVLEVFTDYKFTNSFLAFYFDSYSFHLSANIIHFILHIFYFLHYSPYHITHYYFEFPVIIPTSVSYLYLVPMLALCLWICVCVCSCVCVLSWKSKRVYWEIGMEVNRTPLRWFISIWVWAGLCLMFIVIIGKRGFKLL